MTSHYALFVWSDLTLTYNRTEHPDLTQAEVERGATLKAWFYWEGFDTLDRTMTLIKEGDDLRIDIDGQRFARVVKLGA